MPLFEVASGDLESEAPVLRDVLADLEALAASEIHTSSVMHPGHRLSSEAQFAMGWWFYTVYVREWFIRGLVEYLHARNPGARDERAALGILQEKLKARRCPVRVRLHKDKPFFAGYWSWLMR